MRNSRTAAAPRQARVIGLAGAALLVGVCLVSTGVAAAQQMSPVINSNLEQANPTGQARRQIGSGNGPIALPDDFSRIRLAPGFAVQMEVFGIPELSQLLFIDKDGMIVVPLAGPVQVGGKTLREAEHAIADTLAAKELVNSPTVNLTLTEYAPQGVVVSGEVQSPGELRLLAPRPLLRVLADAGGVTTSSGGVVEVRHREADGSESVRHVSYVRGTSSTDAERDIVYPGDTVFVARAGIVYVLGAVNRPGGYLMVNSGRLDVPEAVGLAQGHTLIASSKEVIVVRKVEDQTHTYHLRLDRMSRGQSPAFALTDGDMVYVPTSAVKSTLVTYSAILSAAASASIIGVTANR